MAGQLTDDAVAAALGQPLDCRRDVAQPVSRPGLGEPFPEALFGGGDQAGDGRGDGTDRKGAGGIAVIAVEAGADIDADQVALAQDPPRRGDAVHDLLVERGADRARERRCAVAEE
ncbi:hypothetical protein SDC9_211700 [bioreactor metagenome]|uniref:Uncharacterized protein n=1 Tax=bioreactor metagenome TaxID=1076179 RepID=A0A645JXS6_9ZZZZ